MAPRKDQMRIIRQDAAFSAKLGFGGGTPAAAGEDWSAEMPPSSTAYRSEAKSDQLPVGTATSQATPQINVGGQPKSGRGETRKDEASHLAPTGHATQPAAPVPASAARGQVVYVAVSLTSRQAHLAEAWASAARCSVQFLMRRVAQGIRGQVFEDWEREGMPEVSEPRGARGKHPTSVTLTLRPSFAADLAARHDPLGIMGLARVMGPAFRARFQEAFDLALDKAPPHKTTEGEEK